jgi:hypothetical protein
VIASKAPSAKVAQVKGMVIFYPMLFLSGAANPPKNPLLNTAISCQLQRLAWTYTPFHVRIKR